MLLDEPIVSARRPFVIRKELGYLINSGRIPRHSYIVTERSSGKEPQWPVKK
jgi:hypothetical protein